MKIKLLNNNEYLGLAHVAFPAEVESNSTEYYGGSNMLCVVLGSELIRVGGDQAVINPERQYLFPTKHTPPVCELVMPSWLDKEQITEMAAAADAGVPIAGLTDQQLNELLHVDRFWAMLGGDWRDLDGLDALVEWTVRELRPAGRYSF